MTNLLFLELFLKKLQVDFLSGFDMTSSYFFSLISLIKLDLNDIVIISLSIILPLLIKWQEMLDKRIGIHISQFWVYLNLEEINKGKNYYRFRGVLIPNQKEMIKFITKEIEINDINPLLVSGRSGRDNELLIDFQNKIKGAYKISEVLNWGQYIISIIIIIFLLLTF